MSAPDSPTGPPPGRGPRASPADAAAAVVARVQGELAKIIGRIPTRADLRRSRNRWFLTGLVLVLLFELATTQATWDYGYLGDDRYLVRTNDRLDPSQPITRLWTGTWWGLRYNDGLFRPFTLMTFALDRAVFGHGPAYRFQESAISVFDSAAFDEWCERVDRERLAAINATRAEPLTQVGYERGEAWGYHFANTLLHALTTAALILLAARITGHRGWALVGGAVWALHPVQAPAVAQLVGRCDILSGLATLVALLGVTAVRRALWLRAAVIAGGCFVALTSKEAGLAAPVLVFLLNWARYRRRRSGAILPRNLAVVLGVILLAYVGLRLNAVASVVVPPGETPLAAVGASFLQRVGHFGWVLLRLTEVTFLPWTFATDYGYTNAWVPVPATAGDWGVGLCVLGLTAWIGWRLARRAYARREIAPGLWRRGRILPLGLFVAFALAIGPVSNVPTPIGATFANRLFYLPLMAVAFIPGAIAGATPLVIAPGIAYAGCLVRTFAWGAVLILTTITGLVLPLHSAHEVRSPRFPDAPFHPEEPFWRQARRQVPSSAKAQLNVAVFALAAAGWHADRSDAAAANKALDESQACFDEALRLDGYLEERIAPRALEVMWLRARVAAEAGDAERGRQTLTAALEYARAYRDRVLQEQVPGTKRPDTGPRIARESERMLAQARALAEQR